MSGQLPHYDDETELLKAMIAEGIASGVSDTEPETIIQEIIARRRLREAKGNS